MSGGPIAAVMTAAVASTTSSSATSTSSSSSPLLAGSASTVGGTGNCSGVGGGAGSPNVLAAASPNIIGNAGCTNTNKGSQALGQTQLLTQPVVLLPSVHQETPTVPRTGRINGTTDSPKPQRTTTNTRHGITLF